MPWLDSLALANPAEILAAWPVFLLPLIILVSALLEYVIPPYWGDSAILLGFFVAGQGIASPAVLFAAAFLGSCLGALGSFLLGRRFGLVMTRWLSQKRRSRALGSLDDFLERFGEKALIFNRFIPVVRGLFLYGAGAARLRIKESMFYAALSNLAWTSLLMGVGLLTAGSWEQLVESFRQYSRLSGLVAFVLLGFWFLLVQWRARGEARADEETPSLLH